MHGRIALAATVALSFGVAVLNPAVGGAQAPSAGATTFTKDVAPILHKHCASCHRPGGIGPMPLLTFEQARPYARSIRAKVADGTMPPWHAEAEEGTFKNDRRLSDDEKDTIAAWVTGGFQQGNPGDMPPAPNFAEGWTIGKPDVVLAMQTEYEVQASGEIPYQYFEIPTNFSEDKWVQAIEVMPGALSVVHHVLVFSREPGTQTRPTPAFVQRQVKFTGAPEGGAGPRTGAQRSPAQGAQSRGNLIATTAPGTNAQVFAPNHAMLVKKGSILSFQVHYTASGKATKDRSSVGFVFAKTPPQHEVHSSAIINAGFVIPAGAASHRVDSAVEFLADSHVLAIFPHTHLRGKSWEYRLTYPDGRTDVVLAVPNYDFNWQTYYEFTKPLAAPKGSRLEATAHYDNSPGNRANPDPKIDVRWGEQTWEEMQYTGITFTIDQPRTTTGQGQQP